MEDGTQGLSTPSIGMLGLQRQGHRLLVGQLIPPPESIHEIEPEVASERLFDDFAVPLAAPGRSDLHGSKDVAVDCQRGPNLRHGCIIAS